MRLKDSVPLTLDDSMKKIAPCAPNGGGMASDNNPGCSNGLFGKDFVSFTPIADGNFSAPVLLRMYLTK